MKYVEVTGIRDLLSGDNKYIFVQMHGSKITSGTRGG